MTKCPRCGKTNPAEIHTCTPPLAFQLADWHKAMADEPKRNESKREKHRRTEVELRRLHAENEGQAERIQDIYRQLNDTEKEVDDLRLLLRQALEALEQADNRDGMYSYAIEIAAIKERLK